MIITAQRPLLSASGHKDMSDAHGKSIGRDDRVTYWYIVLKLQLLLLFLFLLYRSFPPPNSKWQHGRNVTNIARWKLDFHLISPNEDVTLEDQAFIKLRPPKKQPGGGKALRLITALNKWLRLTTAEAIHHLWTTSKDSLGMWSRLGLLFVSIERKHWSAIN